MEGVVLACQEPGDSAMGFPSSTSATSGQVPPLLAALAPSPARTFSRSVADGGTARPRMSRL